MTTIFDPILGKLRTQDSSTKTVTVTIGNPAATGVMQKFTSAANKTEQGIQLTGAAMIPAFSRVLDVVIHCTENFTGSAGDETGFSCKIGTASGGTQLAGAANVDDVGDLNFPATGSFPLTNPSSSATSIYISATPTVNDWDELTAGKITCSVTYIENA